MCPGAVGLPSYAYGTPFSSAAIQYAVSIVFEWASIVPTISTMPNVEKDITCYSHDFICFEIRQFPRLFSRKANVV